MPEEIKRYKSNGKVYKIPVSKASSFLKDMPDAKEVELYTMGDKKYNIPLDKVESFLKDMPNAKLVKKKDNTSTSSQSGIQENQEISTGSASENGNGGILGKVKSVVADNAAKAEEHNRSISTDGLVGEEGPELSNEIVAPNDGFEYLIEGLDTAKLDEEVMSEINTPKNRKDQIAFDLSIKTKVAADRYGLNKEQYVNEVSNGNLEGSVIYDKQNITEPIVLSKEGKIDLLNGIVGTLSHRPEFEGKNFEDLAPDQQRVVLYEFSSRYLAKDDVESYMKDSNMDTETGGVSQVLGSLAKGGLGIFSGVGDFADAASDKLSGTSLNSEVERMKQKAYYGAITEKEYNEWVSNISKRIPKEDKDNPYLIIPKYEQVSDLWINMWNPPSAGDKVRDVSNYLPSNPNYQGDFLMDVLPQGVGSMAAFMASGGAKGAALLGATSNGGSMYKEAIDNGATEEDAYKAMFLGAGIGASESITLGKYFKRFNGRVGNSFRARLTKVIKEGTEEGLQEVFTDAANNLTAQQLYDETREIINDESLESFFVGQITGSLMTLATTKRESGDSKDKGYYDKAVDLIMDYRKNKDAENAPPINKEVNETKVSSEISESKTNKEPGDTLTNERGEKVDVNEINENDIFLFKVDPPVMKDVLVPLDQKRDDGIFSYTGKQLIDAGYAEFAKSSVNPKTKQDTESEETLKVGDTIELSTEISEDTIDTTGNEAGESVTPIGEETREGTGDIEDKQAVGEVTPEVKPISEQTTEELEAKKDAPLDPGEDVDWEDFLNQQAEAEMARASVDSDVSKIETTQEPSVFSDKNGNTVVEGNEGIEVYNSKGDAVSGATREKVLRERAKSMSTSKMTTMHEGATDQEYNSTVASESNNPQEIAMAINAEKSKLGSVSDTDYKEGGDVEALIANSIGTSDVNAESLIEEGVDPASLSAGAKSSFKIKSGFGISAKALVDRINEDLATEGVNQEITIDNLKDFINTYNSLSDYKKKAASNLETEIIEDIVALEGRFTEVTGLPATDKNINDIYEQITRPNKKESTTSKAKSTNTTKEKAKPRVTDYTKKGYGDSNKGVSNDKAVDLKTKFKAMMNNANSGLNPEALSIAAQLAAYHIEAGSRKFADFSKAMVADLGDVIKPHLVDLFNGGVKELKGIVPGLPPLYKKPSKKKKSEGPEQKKLSYIKRVMKSYKGQKELLDAVEAEGTTYETVSHKKVNPMADKIMDEALAMDNPDAAFDAIADSIGETTYDEVTSNLYLPTLQSLIAHKIINYYYKTGDVKRFAKWSKRFADIGNSFGQFLSAMQNSAAPEALVNNAIASVQEGKSEALKGKESEVQELQDFVEKILEEKAREIAKSDKLAEKLKEAVAKAKNAEKRAERAASGSTQRSTKQKAKSLADKIRSHKTDPSRFMFSQVVPITPIYDAALEIVAQVIEKGGTLADAVERGLKHLKKSKEYQAYQPHQQAKIDAMLEGDVKELTSEESGPDLDNIQDDIAKVIEDHFVKGNMKPTKLADVLIEKLGISQELANEIQEDVVSEIAAELETRLQKKFGLDKENNKKPKKEAKKQATVVDSIVESIQYGALDQGTFQNHFAEKYGFANITPAEVAKIEEMIGYIFDYNGSEMSLRKKKELADYLETLKPMTSKKFFDLMGSLLVRAALTGFNTIAVNIPIGSLLSYGFNMGPKFITNPKAYKAAREAWREAGLNGMGRQSFADVFASGFNVLDVANQKFDGEGTPDGDMLDHYLNNYNAKKIFESYDNKALGTLAVVGRSILQTFKVANFAGAFDTIMNHKGSEMVQFINEYNEVAKMYKGKPLPNNVKSVADLVKTNLGYDKSAEIDEQIDKELDLFKEEGMSEPKGYRKRRKKEIMESGRKREKVDAALEFAKFSTLMNNPDGVLGMFYDKYKKVVSIKDSSKSNKKGSAKAVTDTVKFYANATLGLFMRIGITSSQGIARNTPVLGMASPLIGYRYRKVGNNFEPVKMDRKERIRRAVENATTSGLTIAAWFAMFEQGDDDEWKLKDNRWLDITGMGTGEFKHTEQLSGKDGTGVDKHKNLYIRLKIGDTWHNILPARLIPQLMPLVAILGQQRDKQLYLDGKTKVDSSIIKESLENVVFSTTELSFNSIPQFNKGLIFALSKKDNPLGEAGAFLTKTAARPIKTILQPNVVRDSYLSVLAAAGTQERTGEKFTKSIVSNFYGLDYMDWGGNMEDMVDMFGYPVKHIAPMSKSLSDLPFIDWNKANESRFQEKAWDVMLEHKPVYINPHWPKGETEKEKLRQNKVWADEMRRFVEKDASKLRSMDDDKFEAYLQAYSKVAKAKAKISK